jgi:carbonic anhydrase
MRASIAAQIPLVLHSDPEPYMTSHFLDRNKSWVQERLQKDPSWFAPFAAGQAPTALWIGCADSRVPPEIISGSGPGELFVHRNIANIAQAMDLSLMSVLQYAVQNLKVSDVIVCGHIHCGGVAAALDGYDAGLLDNWLAPVVELAAQQDSDMCKTNRPEVLASMVASNVEQSVRRLAATRIIRTAWSDGQPLKLHGWVYDPGTGLLRDLDCTTTGPST